VGRTRRRLAVDLVTELERVDKRIKAADVELRELIAASGSTLLESNRDRPVQRRPAAWRTSRTNHTI